MSDMSDQKPKPLITFVFDEVTVLTLKAEPNPKAKIIPPPGKNAPLLTVEADEMIEFVVKTIPAKDLENQTEGSFLWNGSLGHPRFGVP